MRAALLALLCALPGIGGCGPADHGEPAGGGRAAGDLPPLRVERPLLDLARLLRDGDPRLAVLASPAERPLAAYPRQLLAPSEAGARELASDADAPVIRAAAGSAFALDIERVPAGARLLARTVVLSPHRKDPERADPWPVTFRVRADDEPLAELSSAYVREPGASTPYDQILRTLDLDLAPFAGRPVTLHFEVLPGPEAPPPGAAVPETGWWDLVLLHETEQPRQAASPSAPNLLVLVIDTLAGGRTSLLGHERPTTPRLAQLAARGTHFTRAWSPASWTLPSTASLFTGLPPNTHGVLGDDRSYLMEGLLTWAEALRGAGVEGAAFVGNPLLTAGNNFDQGFGQFENLSEPEGVDAPEVHARFLAWLDAQPAGARWFAYVHTMDPHAPYGAPGDARARFVPPGAQPQADLGGLLPKRLQEGAQAPLSAADQELVRALYDGEVAFADAALGELLDALETRGALQDTLVIVTADHGEELWEHGRLGHGYALNEPMLHVPLVLAGRHVPAGRVVERPVSTASLAATLMVAGGVEPPDPQMAPSLLPLVDGSPGGTLFAHTSTKLFGPPRVLVAAREGARKVVLELDEHHAVRAAEYVDLAGDTPRSVSFLALPEKERDAWLRLVQRAARWAAETAAARPAEPQVLDDAARAANQAALEALGYIGDDDR